MSPVQHSILVADDDSNDVFMLQRLLSRAGIRNPVHIFTDGESIVAHLRALAAKPSGELPLLVFLDIKMPKLDGLEVLRWIRDHGTLKNLPVVILSGSDEPRDLKRAKELEASDYLIKHPPATVLLEVVTKYSK